MLKYYLLNTFCMLVDSVLLFCINFARQNRSLTDSTGKAPVPLCIAAVCALVITAGVYIAEVMILKKQDKLTVPYLIISVILLSIPYLVWKNT